MTQRSLNIITGSNGIDRQWRGIRKRTGFLAWIGLVPKQMSTGDRTILGRISKRGNGYLRMLFMQAARVILLRPASWPKRRLRGLARSRRSAPPSQRFGRRSRQQAGTDRLDGAGARARYETRLTKAAA